MGSVSAPKDFDGASCETPRRRKRRARTEHERGKRGKRERTKPAGKESLEVSAPFYLFGVCLCPEHDEYLRELSCCPDCPTKRVLFLS